jgi:hypothetical protein
MNCNQQTFSHLLLNQRKRIITAIVALVFIGAGTTSYAGHNNNADKIVAGALIGAVVGLSLVSHRDRHGNHYDRHRKHQKYYFHGDHRCYKRHKTHKRHQQYSTHHNYNYNYNSNHNDHYRGYQYGQSQHRYRQHKRQRADREVHHYYNDQRSTGQSGHSKHQSSPSKQQPKHQSKHQSNEGYVSVRSF